MINYLFFVRFSIKSAIYFEPLNESQAMDLKFPPNYDQNFVCEAKETSIPQQQQKR